MLFSNIQPHEIEKILECICARRVSYKKDEIIIEAGSVTEEFGILLEGSARSVKWDAGGKLIIITMVEKNGAIGVLLAANPGCVSPLTVQATTDTVVLQIPYTGLITRCAKNCPRHERLLQNFIAIVAAKGLELHERINCLLEPSVRDKILTYLSKISREKSADTFNIPINRNIMAEYLNVERSALSRELSRMKKDGLIDYSKNKFSILTRIKSSYP
ncbi:MAG: Crp/Fnr family transcriptional regulator [Defluviitaleaceae bacterium]|nr:Crp/Fnr family transcriptional regulator [Defluviitaleaceae bacterium]